jgi:hypothetical protein
VHSFTGRRRFSASRLINARADAVCAADFQIYFDRHSNRAESARDLFATYDFGRNEDFDTRAAVRPRDATTSVQPVFIMARKQRAWLVIAAMKKYPLLRPVVFVRHISGVVWSAYMRPKNSSNVRRRPRPSLHHVSRPVRS